MKGLDRDRSLEHEIERASLAEELDEVGKEEKDDDYWLRIARSAYETSDNYLETNIRPEWETSIAHQNNEHAEDSKYAQDTYRGRSKTFRPKTRTNNISAEASFAKALFSTSEYTDVQPSNPNNAVQRISAEINQYILQHRLEKTIPWYQTAMGAYQDARVHGICFSYQTWEFIEDDDGNIIKNEPVCELLAPENVRVEPNADWRDPINSSAYVIRLVPMYATEIMDQAPSMGWRELGLGEIIGAGRDQHQQDDTTRRVRQGYNREDPAQQLDGEVAEFTLCWLHENFIRVGDEDMVFWTVGRDVLLSDPIPVQEAYPHLRRDERPITCGSLLIEPHKVYPLSPTYIIAPLQKDVNDIVNQRFDNVRLVLNKRYIVRRGQTGIDVAALARSVPGGSVYASNPESDIRELSYSDVTGSSYVEQDRLDLAIDEVSGTFSQQSVQSNRNLNETVGGMSMMQAGASDVQEYMIRNFIISWVENTLSQLLRLEQYYEDDDVIMALAFESSDEMSQVEYQRFNMDETLDMLLRQELTVTVNAGFGAVNPEQKIQRMTTAINTVAGLPTAVMRMKEDEVIDEVYGALGYRDGRRFFKSQEEFQEEMAQQQQGDPIAEAKIQLEQERLKFDMQRSVVENELAREKLHLEMEMKKEIEMMKLAHAEGMKLAELQSQLGIEQERITTQRQVEAGRQALDQAKMALEAENLEQGYDTYG